MANGKKEITDFLWDWAGNQIWAMLLADTIIKTSSNLSAEDRQNVFDYFLQSIEIIEGLPEIELTKPNYNPSTTRIALVSISEVEGVTKLAKNQTIEFSPNITVIYGENGAGKTSYGRIIKSLGFSYDNTTTILNNIFSETDTNKKAKIKFNSNGTIKDFDWNNIDIDDELCSISVFNENCVKISLDERQLLVSPIGFHLFNLISSELDEMAILLNKKANSLSKSLPWLTALHRGTVQYEFVTSLSHSSSKTTLIEISLFNQEHEEELERKNDELSKLNKSFLKAEISKFNLQIKEFDTLLAKLKEIEKVISDDNVKKIIEYQKELVSLESKKQISIKDVADANGVELYESEEFKSFLSSVEAYIKLLDTENYPSTGDLCVLCHQELNTSGTDLILGYRKILNDDTQIKIRELKSKTADWVRQVGNLDIVLHFNQPSFGIDENENPAQPEQVIKLTEKLKKNKLLIENNQITIDILNNPNYSVCIRFLEAEKNLKNIELIRLKGNLDSMEERETELNKDRLTLIDRKMLNENIYEIISIIDNLAIIAKLNAHSNSFNTTAISRKTSEAREELVRQNFTSKFEEELKLFRKSNIKVDFNFKTTKGSSVISQRINSHILSDILSEGEQKVIALAAFLTELQLDISKSPVVFDDPVNSLDHKIIDEAAKRFIRLSTERQVIVFTHNILLLNSFIQQSELDTNKQNKVEIKFNSVRTNFDETGIVGDVEELNSYSYYISKLNAVLSTKQEGQEESKLAAEGYGHLRSAIEVSVEEDILKKTVKRYRKGVAFPSLLRIEGKKIDDLKSSINDIYEKCCVSIDGHSSPTEIHTTPTIIDLKNDFEQFKLIRRNFT
jgi:energy-coupling factor transporter ATP-binding protein EcfA2